MSKFWTVQKPIPAKGLTVYVKADNWGRPHFVRSVELAHKFTSRERAEKVASYSPGFVVVERAA